ncbi:MAG: erythromycin esterase family protein [Myxococcota bacterium]|nr:erythromycin esterase family protein [Myxococcota bacterium]
MVLAAGLLAGAACDATEPQRPGRPDPAVAAELRALVVPITEGFRFDPIIELAAERQVVLLGEATHGTDEFYRTRALISRRLVEEHGFDSIVLEADWPAVARVDRYIRGEGSDASAGQALAEFQRFAVWMWRNQAFAELVEELRALNATRAPADQVRLFGMDLYSPIESGAAVVRFLDLHDPAAARAAERAYTCLVAASSFQRAANDPSCAEAVAEPLAEVTRLADQPGGFSALQNARVAVNAERYYRLTRGGSPSSWNHRDRHMVSTLVAIEEELRAARGEVRQIVWAHNSHLGDARATAMSDRGEVNVGQLARELWDAEVLTVGFTTYTGTVFAAPAWGAPGQVYDVRPGRADSIEGWFHAVGVPAFVLITDRPGVAALLPRMLERAIGVIYRPSTELQSHYFAANIAAQFDAVIHFDTARALVPLDRAAR